MACVVVLSLMRTLELEFLQPLPRPILQQNQLIPCNKHLVLSLHNKLGSLMELFDENRMDGVEAIKDLETKLRDVASRTEDEIELQVVHLYEDEIQLQEEENRIFDIFDKTVYHNFQPQENHIYVEMPQGEKSTHHCQTLHQTTTHHCQRLHQILHPLMAKSHPCLKFRRILHPALQHIDAITQELMKAKEEYQLSKHYLQGTKQAAPLHVLPKPTDQVITMTDSSHPASRSKEIMVGKQDEFEIIKEMLIQHPSKQLEIVSIKGMGGIGKTTLARQIYEDSSITSYFDKQAWVVTSQHHNKRQMLIGLLGFKDNNADNSSNEGLALQLYQSLKCQRYLIVMDDVWSEEAWDAVKTCFPDDGNGSRVLLTTRLAEVAKHTCSKDEFSHQMQFFEQSESWQLFYEKACKSRSAEFEMIGRPVVEKCKGLPLAIIVVAGLFSKLNTLDEWKNMANALSSSATTLDDDECSRILSLSYNHLPHNLKACFLYLGVFPEDHEINANELARLWLAEGLVKAFENESFDEVANRYMQELMDRNLIILSQLCSLGKKIKRFRMHDLLHAFCVREAQKENLLHVVMSENMSDFPQKGFRWVSIQYEDFNMSTIQHYTLKSYRSYFCFLWGKSFSNFINSNLLRVVFFCNVACVRLKNNVNTVHLRFVRVGNDIELSRAQPFRKSRPRKSVELSRSWNLQTLYCYGKVSYRLDGGGKYSEFPQLHQIFCNYYCGNPLNFVHKLNVIRAKDCSEEYVTNIPFLKKVRIRCEGNEESNANIANLAYLEHLERLWILGGDTHIPTISNGIVLLKNLRKLALTAMRFEWEDIHILSMLPRLEVFLIRNSSGGKEWKIQEEVIFCQLIALVISFCDLKLWKASSHNFPKLEHLYILHCYELREIPIDFAEISTLKSIKLKACLHSAVESAKKIQDEQRDYGNCNMVVIEEITIDVLKFKKNLSEEEQKVDN